MLTNLLDNNVTGQILSGVLGAIIAFIASFLLLRFNYKDLFAKTVSQDRIVWLKQMREYAENLFHYIRNNDSKEQRDYNGKTYYDYAEPILLRLNLKEDEDSDEGRIIALIRGDFNTLKDNLNCDNKNDLLRLFRSMLKDEWEKVKCEAKGYEELSNKNRFGTINLSKWIVKGILFISLYVLIGIIIGHYLFPKIDKVAITVMGWFIYGLVAGAILFLNLMPTLFKNMKTKEKGVEGIRMKKPCALVSWFIRQWKGILLVLLGIAFLAGNIFVLLYVPENSGQSAWLTLISGWISGFATLFIGIITYKQSKTYSFLTKKTEVINSVLAERKEFLSDFLGIVETAKYTDTLIVLCNTLQLNTSLTAHFAFYTKITCLRDDLIRYCNMVLSYSFIPKSMLDLHTKTTKMMQYCIKDFDLKDSYNDKDLFGKDIQVTIEKILNWINEMHLLKQSTLAEMDEELKQIDATKSLNELTHLFDEYLTKSYNSRKSLSKEQNNGQIKNDVDGLGAAE